MIVGTFAKIPKKETSHSFGYARTWSENLEVDLDHKNLFHKNIYVLPGANFGGTINLMGGFNDFLKESVDNFLSAENITFLDGPPVAYGEQLKKRKDVEDKGWCDAITQKLSEAKSIVGSDLKHEWLAIGDSHTCAYAPLNSSTVKQDGTTLNNQINTDFEYIRSHIKSYHKGLTISLGNIDIRHHIVRLNADVEAMISSLNDFGKSTGLEVEYGLPWPIEFEGRKLPKTGYYDKRPFTGSREERSAVVKLMERCMTDLGMSIVKCPNQWYDMDPEIYATGNMERPQSVHLNPMKYRRKNWGELTHDPLEIFMS